LGADPLGNGHRTGRETGTTVGGRAGTPEQEELTHMKILRAILNTIVDIVMLPFRAIGRLLGAGESTAKGGRRRR
jgi:hypothetical protein